MGIKKNGFTFIELIVVTAMFSLVAIVLYSCLMSGIRVWSRSLEFDREASKEYFVIEKATQKIRNSLNYSRIGFEGEDNYFSFPAKDKDEIVNISYSFSKSKRALIETRKDFEEFSDDENGTSHVIFSKIRSFSFSYRYFDKEDDAFLWKDEWERAEGIPKWIKIEYSRDGKDFKERIVSIPIS